MKKIGGFFPIIDLPTEENGYLASLTPDDGDIRYCMSGRCGIYYALMDILQTDTRRVAYVPIYTCETVLAPFEKAGFDLIFYDFTKDMVPIFDSAVLDKISVISICGYYGFSNYDKEFIAQCSKRGIKIIEDTTHSIFSEDGVDPHCDYIAGSFRKWIGVPCGGFAIKTHGKFHLPLLDPDPVHLKGRKDCLTVKDHFEEHTPAEQEQLLKRGDELFWESELLLRRIFDSYRSDEESIQIMNHYPIKKLQERRRSNYQYLLDHLTPSPKWKLVFPELTKGTVPSHLTVYADDREAFKESLLAAGIGCTCYWPVGPLINLEGHPDAAYIYDHVCSIPCDQRYDEKDMQEICDVLNQIR